MRRMRWERLFADLEGQFEEAERLEREAEIADRTQREQALVRLADRLRSAVGGTVEAYVPGAGTIVGEVSAVGADWLAIVSAGQGETLVPFAALHAVTGLPARGVAPETAISARLGLGYAIRTMMRERFQLTAVLIDGRRISGTVSCVGADYFDMVADKDDAADGRATRTSVAFGGLAALSCR